MGQGWDRVLILRLEGVFLLGKKGDGRGARENGTSRIYYNSYVLSVIIRNVIYSIEVIRSYIYKTINETFMNSRG